jgi:hypothetical protein
MWPRDKASRTHVGRARMNAAVPGDAPRVLGCHVRKKSEALNREDERGADVFEGPEPKSFSRGWSADGRSSFSQAMPAYSTVNGK